MGAPAGAAALGTGVACALGAGLTWGLVFVAPVMLPQYPAVILSVGRYAAFGLIALALAVPARAALARLSAADWIEAAELSLVGNLLYYGFLAGAIQAAGVPLPTMIIGTLPVVIAVVSNLSERTLPWRRLAPSLGAIAAGIALVNHAERARQAGGPDTASGLALGAVLALCALVCWTWYPIRNARWMRANGGCSPATWATAQGLTTLPLAILGWGLAAAWHAMRPLPAGAGAGPFDFPLGANPVGFVVLMVTIGLTASWLGTLLWNQASRLLPTSLTGQLIVFETLAALAYGFAWRGETPSAGAAAGIALLGLGITLGVRALSAPPSDAASR